jgi:exodeoxyribonuclease-5
MTTTEFHNLLIEKFPFDLTIKQDVVLQRLSSFIFDTNDDKLFVLKGYAGTGKTTLISTLVNNLWHAHKSAVLLAPTGRAAKVISKYAKREALTIHKKIYFPKKQNGGGVSFVLQPNKHKNTVFIVDEASMISDITADSKLFDNGSLLDDLLQYVYAGHKCKLVFIGDTAQLPPVKLDVSPALDEHKLALNYNKDIDCIELDEVVRQAEGSGILSNATLLREQLASNFFDTFQFNLGNFTDIVRLQDGYDIQNAIDTAYSSDGKEDTAIIVRSNKRANIYNQQIRSRILYQESDLNAGDYLMTVKNNYFWIKENSEAGFIANGDIIEVLEIFSFKELYGFRFAEVKVRMVDYPNMQPFETVLLLDTISAESPALSYEDSNRLYQEVQKDYESESSKYKKFMKIKQNKYFNALQVKFSYAITCHKSQGGQWKTVFVEQPYLPNGVSKDYMRWLYTAITRAEEKLYLIGFGNDFFTEEY